MVLWKRSCICSLAAVRSERPRHPEQTRRVPLSMPHRRESLEITQDFVKEEGSGLTTVFREIGSTVWSDQTWGPR